MARGAKTTGDESEGEMFHLSVLSYNFTVTQRRCVAGPQLGFVVVYSRVGLLPCCLLERSFWRDFCNGAKLRRADRESGTSHIG